MPSIIGKCCRCGSPLHIAVAGPFAAAALVAGLCSRCTDQQFVEGGGTVLNLKRSLDGARFPLGKITITAGAILVLAEANQHAITFLGQHVQGDWGVYGQADHIVLTEDERRRGWEATDDTGKINTSNLLRGCDRIFSEYTTSLGRRLWVITSLGGEGSTTVLMPEEY